MFRCIMTLTMYAIHPYIMNNGVNHPLEGSWMIFQPKSNHPVLQYSIGSQNAEISLVL